MGIGLFVSCLFVMLAVISRAEMNMLELPHSVSDDRCSNPRGSTRTVHTRLGVISGRAVSLCDEPGLPLSERPREGTASVRNTVRVFLGIPYAEPPVGDLRFQPPKPSKFHGEINALDFKPSCPQNLKHTGYNKGINITDENCLYLNIYTPEMRDSVKHSGYPVMMYIHGGNWDHGSANLFPAHMLAAQDVVVVTFNYRLGHLGFLSTGNSASVGNYGILDQILALEWVYDHINSFGGDKMSITLFGFDAGAVSASLLAISSRSKSMVKRVIAQNGSPLADWGIIVDKVFTLNTSRILGEALGCSTDDSYKLITCLNTRTNNEYQSLEIKPRIGWLPWGPVVDNFSKIMTKDDILFPRSPVELLTEGSFSRDFAVMTGTSRDEGVNILLADQALHKLNYRMSIDVFRKKIEGFQLMHNYSMNFFKDKMLDAILFMYLPNLDMHNETLLRQAYVDLLTDHYYKAPNYMYAKHLIRNGVKTYLYVCNYTFEGYQLPFPLQGISSETEYLLLTGAPFMNSKYYPPCFNLKAAKWTRADRDMSHFYVKTWTEFAKYGNPTKNSFMNAIFWPPASEGNLIFLNLNTTNNSAAMIEDYRKQECEFWSCYLPFLINRHYPTFAPTLEPGIEELRFVAGTLYGSIAAGALFFIIATIFCFLYLRIQKYDNF